MTTLLPPTISAAIYCRKSTESEDRQILSLSAQRDEANKLAGQLGISRVAYYEEAKSAKISGRRIAFLKMVKDIKNRKVNAIICWKLDRLARNMVEGGQIIDLLQRGLLKAIITPFKTYYPDENALILSVEFGVANQYSRDLSQNVTRGLISKAQMGYPNGLACIGFLNSRTTEKRGGTWLIDQVRFPIVKEIFKMYLSGNYSGIKIHTWAVETAKLTTPKRKRSGNKLISLSGIYRILTEPIYAGYFYMQGERYELAKELPRIVSLEEHRRILAMLGKRNTPKTQTHETLYRGYIKSPYNEVVGPDVKMQLICECRHKFSYLRKTHCPRCDREIASLSNPKYLHYVYYRNISRSKRGDSIKYILEEEVTESLIQYVQNNFTMSVDLKEFCLAHIAELEKESNDTAIIANRMKRINDLEAKKVRFRDMLADDIISRDEYLNDIEKVNAELEVLTADGPTKNVLEIARNAFSVGLSIVQRFRDESVSIEQKRSVLSLLGANLVWDEKNLIVLPSKIVQSIIDGLNEAKSVDDRFTPENTLANEGQSDVFRNVIPKLSTMCKNVRNQIIQELENGNE